MIISDVSFTDEDDEEYKTIVFHQKPMKRIIFDASSGVQKSFFISLPNVFFSICYVERRVGRKIKYSPVYNAKMVFSNTETMRTTYIPPFPNIFYNLNVCCQLKRTYFDSKKELCESVVKSIWSTTFDWNGFGEEEDSEYPENSILGNLHKWEKKTKSNPNWVPTYRNMIKITNNEIDNYADDFYFNKKEFFGFIERERERDEY